VQSRGVGFTLYSSSTHADTHKQRRRERLKEYGGDLVITLRLNGLNVHIG